MSNNLPNEYQEENPTTELAELQISKETFAQTKTMWNDLKTMQMAWKLADMLSKVEIVPQSYRGRPGDCLVAIDMANRMGISPLMVMQSSQVVQGNFSWKGQACKALIDGSGKFEQSKYIMFGEDNSPQRGCYLQAINKKTGEMVKGPKVTWQMAIDEGWATKNGNKWKSMPDIMFRYRAATFFARTECPEVLLGYYTTDELQDIGKIDNEEQKTIIRIENNHVKG